MSRRAILVIAALALAGAVAAMPGTAVRAQTLPDHLDPSAREDLPDLSLVPGIRFLTTTGFPPFNYRDTDGVLVGFNVDLARAVCTVISAQCTIQTWPWEQAADALSDNQGDALIAGLAIDEENAGRFDFSNVYLMLPGRFVTRAENAAGFDPAEPARVAVRAGSAHAGYLERHLPALAAEDHASELEALAALEGGSVDAFFGDAMRASFWLNTHSECCAFAGEPYFDPAWFGHGLAIALPADLDNVHSAINWALARLQRSGRLDELYFKWFPVGFY